MFFLEGNIQFPEHQDVWAADGWRGRYYPVTSAYWGFSFDPQGNVASRQTNLNLISPGTSYDTAMYEAYGRRTADIEANTATNPATHQDPAGFGGQYGYYTDRETGLLCLTHRYYDPGTGRFVNRDPIGYNGGVNLYGFCGGNPVNMSDPSGYAAAGAVGGPLTWTLPKVSFPAVSGTVLLRVAQKSVILWGVESLGELGVYGLTGGAVMGPTMQIGNQGGARLFPPLSGLAAPTAWTAILAAARRNRASEYPHGNSQALRDLVIAANTNAKGQVIDPETKEVILGAITIEHIETVVDHWNSKGYNETAAQRRK